jgi:Tol biopolymer transport system component
LELFRSEWIMLSLLITGVAVSVTVTRPAPEPHSMTELQLTHDTAIDWDPVFSPDGKRIAFSSYRSGSFDIWIMNAYDGKRRMQLTSMGSDERSPKWSSDGKRIAFLATEQGGTDIWVSSIDGQESARLTHDGASKECFEWAPSGELVVYDSNRGGEWNIWLADLHAHSSLQLTEGRGRSMYPSWTSDGREILFSSRSSGVFKIYAVGSDGASLRQLTNDTGNDIKPRMSPDGKYIAFVSDRKGSATLWMMDADGGNIHEALTDPPIQDPGWPIEPNVASESYPLWNSQSQAVMYWARIGNETVPVASGSELHVFTFYHNISVMGFLNWETGPEVRRDYSGIDWSTGSTQQGDSIIPMDSLLVFEQVHASWRRDGKAVVYATNRDGNFDIWIRLLTGKAPSPY